MYDILVIANALFLLILSADYWYHRLKRKQKMWFSYKYVTDKSAAKSISGFAWNEATKEASVIVDNQDEPLAPSQLEWLHQNGPFFRVICQASAEGVEYQHKVTGETIRVIPGADLPETYRVTSR